MPNITIYATHTCPYCKAEMEYLVEKKIPFTKIYVDDDQNKATEMIEKSGQMGVPVTVIKQDSKEEIVVGFDKPRLEKILKIKQ